MVSVWDEPWVPGLLLERCTHSPKKPCNKHLVLLSPYLADVEPLTLRCQGPVQRGNRPTARGMAAMEIMPCPFLLTSNSSGWKRSLHSFPAPEDRWMEEGRRGLGR